MYNAKWFEERKEMIKNCQNSREYREELEKYRSISHEMSRLAGQYKEKPQKLIEKINESAAYKKYGVGGLYIHRGAMCPSPILDLVVGNCKRGSLVNKLSARAAYEYSFDYNDQLIKVISLDDYKAEEYIINCGEYTLGLAYDAEGKLNRITQCFYKENITSYRTGHVLESRSKVNKLMAEEYSYKDNRLETADMYTLNGSLRHRRIFFKHNEEGYLHSYTSQELIGLNIMNKEFCDQVYYIDQKRKI